MAAEITMPQLSDTMSEGTLVKWLKKEGDKVKEGETIAEVETDKATMPMEAFESGTLAIMDVAEGQKVPVGGRIAVMATGKESVDEVKKKYASGSSQAAKPLTTKKAASGSSQTAVMEAPPANPPQTEYASKKDTEQGAGNLEEGRAQSRRELVKDSPSHSSEAISREAHELMSKSRGENHADDQHDNGRRIKISPLARRIARERNIDIAQLKGTGPNGRIVKNDVETFAAPSAQTPSAKPSHAPSEAPALAPRVASGQKEVIPLTKMRTAIAAALQKSKSTVPHFYETVDVDVEEVAKLRERMNKQLEPQKIRLSIGDFVSKAVAVALIQHPALNAHFDGTNITRFGDVNLGIAVALPEGLIVPVLRGIDQMGLKEIRQRSADLAERARAQRLKREELSGATFTVSNLGQYGIKDFSAIINPPEVGILAIGAADKRAVVRNDQIVARTMMNITLSCDHRVVDGATAAEFLRTLKRLLEEPAMMLV